MTGKSPTRRVVCDTGPLISLEKLSGGFRFIRRLYDGLIVPPSVLTELAAGLFESAYAYQRHFGIEDLLIVQTPTDVLAPETLHLDAGEQDAITLALELSLPLLIEEEAGRQVARELGLEISGVAGQLLLAVRQDVATPDEAVSHLVQLRESGRINRQLFAALQDAIKDEV